MVYRLMIQSAELGQNVRITAVAMHKWTQIIQRSVVDRGVGGRDSP
jgi:hypothetical protein